MNEHKLNNPPLLLLGSSDLTVAVAEALISIGVSVAAVVSPMQEFRISYSPKGVSNSRYFDMREWCLANGIRFVPYERPDDISRAAQETGAIAALAVGWYHMVPSRVRSLFKRGCLGVHSSLLPRYRGGAPLNWAILNEDSEAGVTLFELSDAVDDGCIYSQKSFPISVDDYIGDVVNNAESITIDIVTTTIPKLLNGELTGRPQDGAISYTLQRKPSDGIIDWRCSAIDIARLVRAVSRPYPGAKVALDRRPMVVWKAKPAPSAPLVFGMPGQIVKLSELSCPAVVTGNGLLLVEEIQDVNTLEHVDLSRFNQWRFDELKLDS